MGHTLLFLDVLYAFSVHYNLLSIVTLPELDFKFHFIGLKVEFYLNKAYMDKVFLSNDLFMLDLDSSSSYVTCDNTIDSLNWRIRLEHISEERMARLVREGLIRSRVNVSLPMCESCLASKAYWKLFGMAPRAFYPLELVY